VRSPGWARAGR